MSNRKYDHLLEEWIELYTEKELTLEEIANQCEAAERTVSRYLKEASVDIQNGNGGYRKYDHLLEEWIELYTEEELSTTEIADRCEAGDSTISRYLREAGVEMRNEGGPREGGGSGEPQYKHLLEEWVELYTEEGMSTYEIANQYDASQTTVVRYLRNKGIELTHQTVSRKGYRKYEHLLDEWVELYTEEKLPVPEIADRCEASQDTVNRYLQDAEVNIRGGHAKEYQHLVDKWVQLYTEEGMSTYEIADRHGPTPLTISRYLQDAGIEMRGEGNQDLDLPVGEWTHLYRDRHYTVEQIASAYDRDRGIVRKHLKQAGVKTDPHRGNKYPVDEWVQLYTEEDLSTCKIADQYNCGRSTVIKRLRSEGVEITSENKLTKESLLRKVDQSGECWIWKKAPSAQGYGQFSVNGSQIPAHRATYQLWKGEIPDGHYVRHKCDNRQCVRPEHLTTGTHEQNMDDQRRTNEELESLNPDEMKSIIESDKPWHEIAEERGLRIGTVRTLKSSN